MKNYKISRVSIGLLVVALMAFSCSDDENTPLPDPNPNPQNLSTYVVAFQSLPVGAAAVEYIIKLPSKEALMKGELTAVGTGIPQVGWRFYHQTGNTIFTSGYSDDVLCNSYQIDETGTLKKKTDFQFETTLDNYTTVDANTLLAIESSNQLAGVSENGVPTEEIPDRTFYLVDAVTGVLKEKKTHSIDASPGDGTKANLPYLPWVTGMVVRDGKLFLAYQKYYPDGTSTAIAVDKAYVAVLTYPEFELEKLLVDDRTSSIGAFGPSTGIEQAENGDIYSFSSSSEASGIIGATNPSGVLRIPNGTTDFDPTYFFDVENAPNGGKIYWMDYIANGKALARIVLDDTIGPWGAFAEQGTHLKLVVLDLVNKVVTDVQGIPHHANRYTAQTFVEDGNAYITARTGPPLAIGEGSTEGKTFVYKIDVQNATATRGAEVAGLGLKGIFKVSR